MLASQISHAVEQAFAEMKGNIVPWGEVISLLSKNLGVEGSKITLSKISHRNYRVRITQPGFNRKIQLGVFVADSESPFTDGVRLGLHECRESPQFALLVLMETRSRGYEATDFVAGPVNGKNISDRVKQIWPGVRLWSYKSVWG